MNKKDEKKCKQIFKKHYKDKGCVIPILLDIQKIFRYIPEDIVDWFSEKLNIPASKFYGVATAYHQFHLKRRGKYVIKVCIGIACWLKGAGAILERIRSDLGISPKRDTAKDRMFTVKKVSCVGACGNKE